MPRPTSAILVLTVLATFALGAAGCGSDGKTSQSAPADPDQNALADQPSGIEQRPCKRKFATYLKHQGGPLPLVIGCYMLVGSDLMVEVSAEDQDFGQMTYLCLNRRYSRIQVPSACTPDARPLQVHLLGVEHPRSAPRGTMVAIGIVPVRTDEVVVRSRTKGGADGAVHSEIEKMPPVALQSVHGRSFRYFLAALPADTCGTVVAEGREDGAPVSRASRRKAPC